MHKSKIIILVVLLAIILTGCTAGSTGPEPSNDTQKSGSIDTQQEQNRQQQKNQDRVLVKVTRVVDGDTVEVLLNGKEEAVRLIGVDTPETKHSTKPVEPYGPEASAFTQKALEGKEVYLEFDTQERDRYGRLLCYLYLEDGIFFNAELVSLGYAQVLTVPPNVRYSELLVKLQQEARENQRGLWGLEKEGSTGNQEELYIGGSNSMKFHRPECVWGQKIAQSNKVVFNSRGGAIDQGFVSCKVCGP